ncbi:hypothetical protein CC78DRAFT_74257 [Lojkania enalia]|uniref:LIM zinc-binding domain-containing protein n=1 Tax=Lojkania enalia TaxID=147567 RepID=A0A9P4N221_9PLEO|nr:hypothetical protein CC78DRAFT_74257 [Didymosphaeria enalia]
MAATERPISFLPSIKCSTCGVDIQISQLADHVCATNPSSNPESQLERAATFGGAALPSTSSGQSRPGRMPPPPRIDPTAANKPFTSQNDLLSPLSSYSDPKNSAPLSPGNGKLPFKMNRSATSPMPRALNPPSPALSSNMDCAFPPFPTSRSATPTGGKSNKKCRAEPKYKHRYAEPDPLYAPLSPRTDGGESVLKRMNSIAPGPFDGRGGDRRPSTSHGRATPTPEGSQIGHKRTPTQNSIDNKGRAPSLRSSVASNKSGSSNLSSSGIELPARPKQDAARAMAPPPRPPRTEGIDEFLDRLQKETMQPSQIGPNSRSKTFPIRQESRDDVGLPPRPRRPSESNNLTRKPTGNSDFESSRRPANPFPSRSTSRGGSRSGVRPEGATLPLPPMPSYGKEIPQKPLHTPSDSGLSDDSTSSSGSRSAASSRSSPPASEASAHSRKPSNIGQSAFIDGEHIQRVASPDSFALPPLDFGNKQASTGYDRGKAPGPLLPPSNIPFSDALESPLDPAIQRGLLYQKRPSEPQSSDVSPTSPQSRSPPRRLHADEPQALPRRRPTMANKGNCRGCGEAIIGKSVKDSSGRLTGRYHKECFVCKTCRSPFPSADFYVFDNSPYCEQHYHKLNGSLCKSCNRGIEGQYLETDQRQKFHPRCFTCLTCRVVLRDDYYEVGGKVYCERHAYHASQQNNMLGPGGNRSRNLQKRTTRLMMMA